MRTIRTTIAVLSLSATAMVLQGCLSVPINVRSDPSGANVLADGKLIGTTPMQMRADRVFPARRKGLDWHREGTLTLERTGCAPKTLEVDNELLKRSLNVDLECRPDAPAIVNAPTATSASRSAATRSSVPTSGSTAERLEELERLRKKDLITDQEYRAIRKRILDQL
jgi:hypothetical protein